LDSLSTLAGLIPVWLPAAFVIAAVFLPGRRVARIASLGVAASVLIAQVFPLWPLGLAWTTLWGAIAWAVGLDHTPRGLRAGGAESGAIALAIGVGLLALLFVATLRQNMPAHDTSDVAGGLLLVGLGLLHLMLRRNAVRAAIGFGALGMGLQVLLLAARRASLGISPAHPVGVTLATAIAAALAVRIGRARRADLGSALVSDAHDLHD
jgi:hypothetical protein